MHPASCSNLRLLRHALAALLAWAAMPLIAVAQATPAEGYRLGIFPYMPARQAVELWGPVAADMGAALAHAVRLESTPTFAEFTRELAAGRYDIAHIQPFDYLDAVEKHGYVPLARLDAPLVARLVVRDDSRYRTLESLRGTIIALPPAPSANARMVLRALHDHKLVPGRDVEVRHFNSHDSCLQQVWAGTASACGTSRSPILLFEQRMQARLRAVHDTPAIAHALFVAHRRVPVEHRARLQQLIVGWSGSDAGRALLKNLGFPGFVVPRADEYAVLRNYDAATGAAGMVPVGVKELTLGVFPLFSPASIAKNFAPAQAALARAAGVPVHLRTASSYDSFVDALASASHDIVVVQPFDFAGAIRHGYLPLAGMAERISGRFFVREGSPQREIADFRGQVIAMPPADSAQARLGRQALLHAGLVPGRDVTIEYRRDHESCLQQLQRGAVAACVTAQRNLAVVAKELAQGLRGVGQTESVPGVLFMAHQRLSAGLRERLQAEIVGWKSSGAGRDILRSINFGELVPVNAADYRHVPNLEGGR